MKVLKSDMFTSVTIHAINAEMYNVEYYQKLIGEEICSNGVCLLLQDIIALKRKDNKALPDAIKFQCLFELNYMNKTAKDYEQELTGRTFVRQDNGSVYEFVFKVGNAVGKFYNLKLTKQKTEIQPQIETRLMYSIYAIEDRIVLAMDSIVTSIVLFRLSAIPKGSYFFL